jgi:hypothetical protein
VHGIAHTAEHDTPFEHLDEERDGLGDGERVRDTPRSRAVRRHRAVEVLPPLLLREDLGHDLGE